MAPDKLTATVGNEDYKYRLSSPTVSCEHKRNRNYTKMSDSPQTCTDPVSLEHGGDETVELLSTLEVRGRYAEDGY